MSRLHPDNPQRSLDSSKEYRHAHSRPNGESILDRSDTEKLIEEIISDVIDRRSRGENVSNATIIAAHPELMPALQDELCASEEIHRWVVTARSETDDSPIANSSDERTDQHAESDADDGERRELRLKGYVIDSEISSGGQATVFKAIQEKTGRTVAIKMLHGGPYLGSRHRKRFERESDVLAKLNHPNIVGILDRGRTDDGSFYLVMDFVEGSNLDEYVASAGKDAVLVVRLFIKIARAIEHAHQRGIVHRDLKPMNIRVDPNGEPHILDFGMARLLCDDEGNGPLGREHPVVTHTGQVLGSLPWSSPEQIRGLHHLVDGRGDVYAMGVMLFTSLAGDFPYPVRCNPEELIQHVTQTPPDSLTKLAECNEMKLPRGVDNVIYKALQKSPGDRYPSAGAFADDLEACLAGEPPRIRRPRRRFSKILGFLTVLVISVGSAATWYWWPRPVPEFSNYVGIKMIRVVRGESVPAGANGKSISVDHDFYISAKVITEQEYLAVIGHDPPEKKLHDLGAPVESLTQAEAEEYCKVLSHRDFRTYRLPTPEEWRYAYLTGQIQSVTKENLDRVAWHAGNSKARLQPAGWKAPDRRGLYDMLGNVRQWCSSSTPDATNAVAMGSDFLTAPADLLDPAKLEMELPPTTRRETIGFRIVCESAAQDRSSIEPK